MIRCAYLCGVACLVFVSLADVGRCDVTNGSFESYYYDGVLRFSIPTGWQRIGYAAVMSNFNNRGQNWQLDSGGLNPYKGSRFVVLSSGDFVPEPNYAEIRQPITIAAGDRLTGAYFYGSHDWWPYDDTARIRLFVPDTNIAEVNVLTVSLANVGSYGSMPGWKRFDYVFDANQAGNYDIVISVEDKFDYILNTYFAVDGLKLCSGGVDSEFGDINADCTVDSLDFAMLAEKWLCDCDQPSAYTDPNRTCVYGADISGNGFVDSNDLGIMSDYWLGGVRQP